jgi:hypothetical protein
MTDVNVPELVDPQFWRMPLEDRMARFADLRATWTSSACAFAPHRLPALSRPARAAVLSRSLRGDQP